MKKNIIGIMALIAIAMIYSSCTKDEVLDTPKAEFKVFKGTSAIPGKSNSLKLLEVPTLIFKINDTIIFKNFSTGEYTSIFTGDTIFNANGVVTGGRMADQPLNRFYDVKTNSTYLITAGLLPKPGEDLAVAYGTETKRIFKDESGAYLTGIYSYKYARPGNFKVKIYTNNWDSKGNPATDSISVKLKITK